MLQCGGEINLRPASNPPVPEPTALVRASAVSTPGDAFLLDVAQDATGAASRTGIQLAPRKPGTVLSRDAMVAVADALGLAAGYAESEIKKARQDRFGLIATAVIASIVALGFAFTSIAALKLRQQERTGASDAANQLSEEWKQQVERTEQSLSSAQERFHEQTRRNQLLEREIQSLSEKCTAYESQLLRASDGLNIAD